MSEKKAEQSASPEDKKNGKSALEHEANKVEDLKQKPSAPKGKTPEKK